MQDETTCVAFPAGLAVWRESLFRGVKVLTTLSWDEVVLAIKIRSREEQRIKEQAIKNLGTH